MTSFCELFKPKPIIGMIHCAGGASIALKELDLFEQEGIDGAIIENYHGTYHDVVETLHQAQLHKRKLVVGVNILPNEFEDAFALANDCGAKFIQLDYVAGDYKQGKLDTTQYKLYREKCPHILVMGGVHPKYYTPLTTSNLEQDLLAGKNQADAIVVTGNGTGKETPLEKIAYFRTVLDKYPLIVGAGINPTNAYAQLLIGDGAIVGSCLKKYGKTYHPLDQQKIRNLMTVVKNVRNIKLQKDKY